MAEMVILTKSYAKFCENRKWIGSFVFANMQTRQLYKYALSVNPINYGNFAAFVYPMRYVHE